MNNLTNYDSPYYFAAIELLKSRYLSADEKHLLLNTLMRDASEEEAEKIDALRDQIRQPDPEEEIDCAPEFPNLTPHPVPEYAANEQPF